MVTVRDAIANNFFPSAAAGGNTSLASRIVGQGNNNGTPATDFTAGPANADASQSGNNGGLLSMLSSNSAQPNPTIGSGSQLTPGQPGYQAAAAENASDTAAQIARLNNSLSSISASLSSAMSTQDTYSSLASSMDQRAFTAYGQANTAIRISDSVMSAMDSKIQNILSQVSNARSTGNTSLASNLNSQEFAVTQQSQAELGGYRYQKSQAEDQRRAATAQRDDALNRSYDAEVNSIQLNARYFEVLRQQQDIQASQLALA